MATVLAAIVVGAAIAVALASFRAEFREYARLYGVDPVPGWIAIAVSVGSVVPILVGDLDVSLADGFAFTGVLLGAVVAATGYSRRDLADALATGRDEAGHLATGRTVVSGEAVPDEGATAGPVTDEGATAGPVTGEPALCYEWGVDERKYAGKRRVWSTVAFGSGGVRFAVRDDSGDVSVDPEGADLRLHEDLTASEYADTIVVEDGDPPDPILAFLEESLAVDQTTDDRRYKETRLEPGDEVTVVGEAHYERGQYETETVISGPEDGDFYVLDQPYDEVHRGSHLLTRYGIPGGILLTLAGYVWLFRAAGVAVF